MTTTETFGGVPADLDARASVQLLPRCGYCHAPHPLARGIDSTGYCHACGWPLPPLAGPTIVPALITGWRGRLGVTLIRIGRALARLCEGPSK